MPVGKVIDTYVKSLFSKDSCDGSGLNTSANSKDSHPLNSGGFFLVMLFNFHRTIFSSGFGAWLSF